mgnify:CR=1 FL=1
MLSVVIDRWLPAWEAMLKRDDAFDGNGVLRYSFVMTDFDDLVAKQTETDRALVWDGASWVGYGSYLNEIEGA